MMLGSAGIDAQSGRSAPTHTFGHECIWRRASCEARARGAPGLRARAYVGCTVDVWMARVVRNVSTIRVCCFQRLDFQRARGCATTCSSKSKAPASGVALASSGAAAAELAFAWAGMRYTNLSHAISAGGIATGSSVATGSYAGSPPAAAPDMQSASDWPAKSLCWRGVGWSWPASSPTLTGLAARADLLRRTSRAARSTPCISARPCNARSLPTAQCCMRARALATTARNEAWNTSASLSLLRSGEGVGGSGSGRRR